MITFKELVLEYTNWIKDNTSFREFQNDNAYAVITPFLDRHNDHIEIYVSKAINGIILSDDGNTIADLEMSGVNFKSSAKREKIFRSILSGLGVKVNDQCHLFVEAEPNNVGKKKHALVQAILAVNDMYTLSQESIVSFFKEDVENFLISAGIVFSKDIKLTGKTGFDHNIDFLIQKKRNDQSDKLVKVISHPKKENVTSALFAFGDIAGAREDRTDTYVIYNDNPEENANSTISSESISALTNYKVKPIPWSQKSKCIEEFAPTT